MRFLIDAQLPQRLAAWLREQGHDAIHTLELPRANRTPDTEIVARADAEARIVVTKDADFVDSFQLRNKPGKLLLISTGNISNDELLELWKNHLPEIVGALEPSRFAELSATAVVIHA